MTQDDLPPIHTLPAWQQLTALAKQAASVPLRRRFETDSDRASHYSGEVAGLFVDFSKHHLDPTIVQGLVALADGAGLQEKLAALRGGEAVNLTEQRQACYPSLRRWADPEGNGDPTLRAMYRQMHDLTSAVHSGQRRGATGKAFTDVVNIGIGGSDFGPRLLCDALANQGRAKMKAHFVANIDPSAISDVLSRVPAETTLFLVASKSFGTQETRTNADAARQWLDVALNGADTASHFLAITANPEAAAEFGIDRDNILAVPDWVGGRFSVWSGFGLAVALYAGFAAFRDFLRGGQRVDDYVAATPLAENIPLLLGLLDLWYRNFWGYTSAAILPYEHRLALLPTYLQQLFMESAGKSVDVHGRPLALGTGSVIWGTEGTNGQHSFHQLLHQGSDVIPCDFIAALRSHNPVGSQHRALLSNCFGQSLVLMNGQSTAEIESELHKQGIDGEQAATLARHKAMPGNRPSTTILMESLTATALGSLICLYEYRLLAASFTWNINPFDQWGVERGKQISKLLMAGLETGDIGEVDASTAQLMRRYAAAQRRD